jgi:ABC-type sugar transport system permease subunit
LAVLGQGQRLGRLGADRGDDRDPGSLRERIWAARWCYLFMAPTLVLALLFTFYPLVASWYISFLDWSGLDSDRRWVGFDNYAEAVQDPYFWAAFGRTFAFAAVTVPGTIVLALFAALVLNDQSLRMRAVFRTMFFLPVVTTTAIVGIVMSLVLNPFDGPFNAALLNLGLIDAPVDFLGDPDLSLWAVAGVYVWKWMGISMIYWLVALQTVPQELYEAAQVDGASRWRVHRYVTIPLIMPFAIIITLIGFVGALQTFPLVQAMTGGGPAFSTELVEVYIYRLAFAAEHQPRLGYASAVAVFFGVTVLVLTLAQAWGLRRTAATQRELRSERR